MEIYKPKTKKNSRKNNETTMEVKATAEIRPESKCEMNEDVLKSKLLQSDVIIVFHGFFQLFSLN